MFHGLVHEIVLEHNSLSFPRQAAFLTTDLHLGSAALIPQTFCL